MRSAAGTTTDGTILRYYRCPYSKKDPNCHNQSVRKEVLEQIVIDALTKEIAKPENIALITDKVFELYCAKFTDDTDLRRYEKELAATDKAIKNILAAIEEGIFTPSTKQRLTELEEKRARIEQAITVESAQEKNMLTKDDIERYIIDAIKLSAKQMVELLVERIDVYADKICIKLKYSDTPIEPPTDFSGHAQTDNLSEFFGNTDNNADCACDATQSPQTDKHHDTPDNTEIPDRNCSCRGFLLFSFTKTHKITQTRTYKSGRSRVFTYTRTYILEIYI